MARNRKTATAQACEQPASAPDTRSWWAEIKDIFNAAFCPEGVSWQRNLLGWVLGLAASFVVGAVISVVCNILMVAALSGGYAFLAALIFIISLLVSMYAGSKVSVAVYNTVCFGPALSTLFNFGSAS